jgi:hypothetical protein
MLRFTQVYEKTDNTTDFCKWLILCITDPMERRPFWRGKTLEQPSSAIAASDNVG